MLDIRVFPIEQSPGLMLAKAHGLVRLGLSQTFFKNGFDITPSHWAVLSVLWDKDRITQTTLAKRAYSDRPNITRILDRLKKKGFISRESNPSDGRSFIIQLTKKGRDAQKPLTTLVETYLQVAFKGLSPKEFDTGLRVLRLVTDNLSHFSNNT